MDMKNEENIVKEFRKALETQRKEMLAAANLSNFVRQYFKSRPVEYTDWLKRHNNDYGTMCCSLVNTLNKELEHVQVANDKYVELEKLLKFHMDRKAKYEKLNDESGICNTAEVKKIQNEIFKVQDKMKNIPSSTEADLSYTKNALSALIDKLKTELLDLEPKSEPSDIDARRTVVFEKKMPLRTALFTLLWNTRPQTIPLTVLNLKGWAARFVQRVKEGERECSNTPTMLIFRSRTDNGEVKGSSGKSRICYSCLHMLRAKKLNVSNERVSIQIPTRDRVDKAMSDKTMILMDDINFHDVAWEELNKFCDGGMIRNKGKYLKEGYIFPYGNILGTTNYDLPYKNDKRYPVVEFTPNDSAVVCKNPLVVGNAKFTYHADEDRYDFDDAWETLFAYAVDNSVKWLEEYNQFRKFVVSKCSKQRSKLENLAIAYMETSDKETFGGQTMTTFTASNVVEWIRRNYPNEVRSPSADAVVSALRNLGIVPRNANRNPYRMYFDFPKCEDLNRISRLDEKPVESIFEWLDENAEKSPPEQTDILIEQDSTEARKLNDAFMDSCFCSAKEDNK